MTGALSTPRAADRANEPQKHPRDALRRIALRARTLDEGLATATRAEAEAPDAPHPPFTEAALRAALGPWCKAATAGDEAAFLQRLQWDGLDPITAARAVTEPAPPATTAPSDPLLPAWTLTLGDALGEAEQVAAQALADVAEMAWFPPGRAVPFLHVWVPFVRVARRRLNEQLEAQAGNRSSWRNDWSADARQSLEKHLFVDLASLGALALYEPFSQPPESARDYDAFARDLLAGGLLAFFETFSVLARQASEAVDDWVARTAELIERLHHDRDDLERTLAEHGEVSKPLGMVRDVAPGLSDRHAGGRQVARLDFENDVRLIYKPRSVDLEAAWNALLIWLGTAGLEPTPIALWVVPRDGYGWVEAAVHAPVADPTSYFERAGALLCLADVLRADDLHHENVIATAAGPVVIDGEMLLQPVPTAQPGTVDQHPTERSFLHTQLLTAMQVDAAGRPYDSGALRATGGHLLESARRVWRETNTSTMAFRTEPAVARAGVNVARRGETNQRGHDDDRVLRAEDHTDEVVRGYGRTYRLLIDQRDTLLRALADGDGPLNGFAQAPVRILFRPTDVYGVLLARLATPRYQRRGTTAGLLIESLGRVFAGSPTRPLLWPLAVDERRALACRDVPYFALPGNQTTLVSSHGERAEGHLQTAGLDAVRARLAGLDDEGRTAALARLQRVLAHPPRFLVPGHPPRPDAVSAATRVALVRGATRIGKHLVSKAQQHPNAPIHWLMPTDAERVSLHLYDGAIGVAVFLATLARTLDDDGFAAAAQAAAAPVFEALADGDDTRDPINDETDDSVPNPLHEVGLGACHGLGGLIWGLVTVHQQLDLPAARDGARTVARLIDARRIAGDTVLDLAGGAAGAMVGLLALDAIDPNGDDGTRWSVRAERCADHLHAHVPTIARQGGNIPAGMAHGAAGVGYALARLTSVTGREADRALATRLFDALPAAADRRDARWCNGFPGMALARLAAAPLLGNEENDQILHLQSVLLSLDGSLDDLCCGLMGRLETVIEAGRLLDDPWLRRAGAEVARGCAERGARQGFRFAGKDPVPPQLFSGLSGVGYTLLRAARPQTVPSPLTFGVVS